MVESYDNTFDNKYNSDLILKYGEASESFKKSVIPGEYFWAYLYITSPLSNLQYNVSEKSPPFTLNGLSSVIIDEITIDAFSKRIDDLLGRKRVEPDLVVPQLTVCTALTSSYLYAGWGGVIFFIFIFWSIPIIYKTLVANNPLGIIGISTLCTIYFFSMFDNVLILSGVTVQLVFPFLLGWLGRIKI